MREMCSHRLVSRKLHYEGFFVFAFLERLLEEKLLLVITTIVFHTDTFSSYRKCFIASKWAQIEALPSCTILLLHGPSRCTQVDAL